jgi:hypothetical protein
VQVAASDPASEAVVERFFHVWTPHLLLVDPRGRVGYEWNGFLPPTLFLPEALLGIGNLRLREKRFDVARQLFETVRDDHPRSQAGDAAAYWAAVATYEASGQADGLQAGWDILRGRYPESIWRTKIIFYEIAEANKQ